MKHLLAYILLGAFSVNAAVVTVTAPEVVVTVTASSAPEASAVSEAGASGSIGGGTLLSRLSGSNSGAAGSNSSGSTGATSTGSTSSESASSGSASASAGSVVSGNPLITEDEFMAAWKAAIPLVDPNTPQPTHEQYTNMVKNAGPAGGITTRQELAMFFAQIMRESGGLYFKKEKDPSPGAYGTGAPGKEYYGRGYIQLSWPDNYTKASKALFGEKDTSLYDDPDQVATNEDLAWGVSFYYWKTIVKPAIASNPTAFGLTTNAINGALECRGDRTEIAKLRFSIYTAVLKVWEPTMTPVETGCYN